jgi:GT2 family glycosyltransferase
VSQASLRAEVAELVAQVARADAGGPRARVLDLTAQSPWVARALRERGLSVGRPSRRAAPAPVVVADRAGIIRVAGAPGARVDDSPAVLASCSWLLLIDGPEAGDEDGKGTGADASGVVQALIRAGRLELAETLHFAAPGSPSGGAGSSELPPGPERLSVQVWSPPGRPAASVESLLLSPGRPGVPGRVIISRTSRAEAAPGPGASIAGADLAVADLLDEVAALREELDRGMYRTARKGRDLLARVPYGLPAAKVALRVAIRTRQFVRSRRPHGAARLPVKLDPSGTPYPARDRWLDPTSPDVSIVILNWNRGHLTLAALQHVWRNTTGAPYEVLVVDNGSVPGDLRLAHRERQHYREVRIGVNRYFGEGNNIGAEEARGRWLIFLNNDALPQPGWLEPLLSAIRDPGVGAAGARLLFPDGRIQETGALIQPDGTPIQLEKGMPFEQGSREPLRQVDYCSAAAICLSRQDFLDLRGFDLTWEPAYYEDVDLCLKLRQAGKKVVCATESHVVHLEHATTSSTGGGLDLRGQPEFNRPKFVERWGPLLAAKGPAAQVVGQPLAATPGRAVPMPVASRGREFKVGIYTPYQMVPGGGERYLLMLAAALAGSGPCTLLFPDRYSRLRIHQVAQELGVPLPDHLATGVWDRRRGAWDFDYFVALGNEVTPPVAGVGRSNIYVCQFPFPAPRRILKSRAGADRTYQHTFVYSEFSAGAYSAARSELGLGPRRPAVVHPPCGSATGGPRAIPGDVIRIVSVGRFFRGGHEKRHDVMIRAFRELFSSSAAPRAMELHLVGTAMQQWGSRAYLRGLEGLARGLPVTFHVNAPGSVVAGLLETSHVYWHCAGFEVDTARHPERLEHFGISIVEAMARGCVAVAYDAGGPREIIRDGVDGRLYRTFDELVQSTASLVDQAASGASEYEQLRAHAARRASDFSDDRFVGRVLSILNGTGPS